MNELFVCMYNKDSMKFLPSGLNSLVENLKTKMRPFECVSCRETFPSICSTCEKKSPVESVFKLTTEFIRQRFGNLDHLPLLLQKQIYPYRWLVTGWQVTSDGWQVTGNWEIFFFSRSQLHEFRGAISRNSLTSAWRFSKLSHAIGCRWWRVGASQQTLDWIGLYKSASVRESVRDAGRDAACRLRGRIPTFGTLLLQIRASQFFVPSRWLWFFSLNDFFIDNKR